MTDRIFGTSQDTFEIFDLGLFGVRLGRFFLDSSLGWVSLDCLRSYQFNSDLVSIYIVSDQFGSG